MCAREREKEKRQIGRPGSCAGAQVFRNSSCAPWTMKGGTGIWNKRRKKVKKEMRKKKTFVKHEQKAIGVSHTTPHGARHESLAPDATYRITRPMSHGTSGFQMVLG